MVVENGVRDGNGGWQKDAAGVFLKNPATVDAEGQEGRRQVPHRGRPDRQQGRRRDHRATSSATAGANGESPLGDVIADAQLAWTKSDGAQIALMNPGGIRADFDAEASAGGEADGQVTYGEAFTVQPFNNLVVTQTFTGAQLKDVLEQQFAGFGGQTTQRILQVVGGPDLLLEQHRPRPAPRSPPWR